MVQNRLTLKEILGPGPRVVILPPMGKGTTQPGYRNRNGQMVVRPTHLAGTDHNQYVYDQRCGNCRHQYGANRSDIRHIHYTQVAWFRSAPGSPNRLQGREEMSSARWWQKTSLCRYYAVAMAIMLVSMGLVGFMSVRTISMRDHRVRASPAPSSARAGPPLA